MKKIRDRLEILKNKHEQLHKEIDMIEKEHLCSDDVVKEKKIEKLRLKDEIMYLTMKEQL